MATTTHRALKTLTAVMFLVSAAALTSGCSNASPSSSNSPSIATSSAPTPSAAKLSTAAPRLDAPGTATPGTPAGQSPASTPAALLPNGTAQTNRDWFDSVNRQLFARDGAANGRTIIESLVSAGFDRRAMQVTPDRTSIGRAADSILFSVKIGDFCLLGQNGAGGYSSAVQPALKSGVCLIGTTRAIDW